MIDAVLQRCEDEQQAIINKSQCFYSSTKRRMSPIYKRKQSTPNWLICTVVLLIISSNGYRSQSQHDHPIQHGIMFVSAQIELDETEKDRPSSRPAMFGRSTLSTIQRIRSKLQYKSAKLIDMQPEQKQMTLSEILVKAGKSGLGGGIPGAIAGIIQVISLMWVRTIINHQCRYGTTFQQAITLLYNQGGIPRFYRGMSFALIQAPLARFVSTATNDGVETFLSNLDMTKDWGPGLSTIIASILVGAWRIFLMPIDTCKTVLQIDSTDGFRNLMRKVKSGKINVLYQGSIANAVSAIAAHYPWFYTYNYLTRNKFFQTIFGSNLLRNASIGFISSLVSDTFANAIRVVKTTKQAMGSKHALGYSEVVSMILAADGWKVGDGNK